MFKTSKPDKGTTISTVPSQAQFCQRMKTSLFCQSKERYTAMYLMLNKLAGQLSVFLSTFLKFLSKWLYVYLPLKKSYCLNLFTISSCLKSSKENTYNKYLLLSGYILYKQHGVYQRYWLKLYLKRDFVLRYLHLVTWQQCFLFLKPIF